MQPEDFSQYQGFYLLSDKTDRGSIFVQPVESASTFPHLEIIRNGPSTEAPIHFTIKKDGNWKDLIFGGWPSLYLVSPKFYDVLKDMTGVKSYSTLIIGSKTKPTNSTYLGLSVTGRSGPIIKEWYTEKVVTPGFLPERKGVYFSLESWDGSDFFIPEDTAMIVTTEKVKTVIEQNKLTNVSLTKISEFTNLVF